MRKQIPECSIIIPVFNKWELTRNCLASLREHSSGHDLEIIVVDNGSSDATAPELASYGTGLFGDRFGAIVFSENRNFGPACNAGARAATSPVLFFLNNDTLATPGWLPPLLTGLDGLGCGALGPVLLYEDGTVQHMGVTYGTRGPSHLYQHFPPDHPVVSRKRELQGITGAALMIRADIFRECGEFYEGYRNGFEDLELCVQIRRKGGRLRCLASSRMFHLESQTPGRKDGDAANGDIFAKRCGDAVYTDIHHHALRDGFSFFITDLLTVSAKLQEKDEASLTANSKDRDAATVLRLVRQNPFWMGGREILAQSLEKRGLYEEAVLFRIELAEIEPVVSRYRDLLRLAPFLRDTPWLRMAEEHLATMSRYKNSPEDTRDQIAAARRLFRNGRDQLLEEAFAAKRREWFPGK